MAAVVVTANNLRIDDMENTTGIASIGGGPGAGADPDIKYQGSNSITRASGTAGQGFDFTDTVTHALDTLFRETTMFKVVVTNPGALLARTAPALRLRIGIDNANFFEYEVHGNDTYPAVRSWLIIPIDVNIAGYRDTTTGTPAISVIDYWGIQGDFSVNSTNPNIGMDAIDIGAGLNMVGGDGASADGVFQDFSDADFNTTANRWGYCIETEAGFDAFGIWWIGEDHNQVATATVFVDTGIVIAFPDGLFAAGFSGLGINLEVAATDVTFTSCLFLSKGNTTTTDTRAILLVTGTAGVKFLADSCTFDAFAAFTLTSKAELRDCIITNSLLITQAGGTLDGCIISGATTGDGVAFIQSDDLAEIKNCDFTFSDGHAIEITATGTYSFVGNKFTGYSGTPGSNLVSSSGSNDAAIFNDSGGLVTINVSGGGDTPAIRNGVGATTVVNNNVALTFSGLRDNTEVRVFTADTTTELAGIENATDGTSDDRSVTFSLSASISVDVRFAHGIAADGNHYIVPDRNSILDLTWPTVTSDIPITQVLDRNFDDPV